MHDIIKKLKEFDSDFKIGKILESKNYYIFLRKNTPEDLMIINNGPYAYDKAKKRIKVLQYAEFFTIQDTETLRTINVGGK